MLTRSTTTDSGSWFAVSSSAAAAASSVVLASATAVLVFVGAEEDEAPHEQEHGPAHDREVLADRGRRAQHGSARERDERVHGVQLEEVLGERRRDELLDAVHRARHVDQDAEEVREDLAEVGV